MAYTDEATVRKRYPFLRRKEKQLDKTGTTITLKQEAIEVVSVYKNGLLLTEGGGNDYTWLAQKITLAVAAISADFFKIIYDVNLETDQIDDLLTNADNIINAKMVRRYGSGTIPFSPTPPLIKDIATMITGAFALKSTLFKGLSVKEDGGLKTADNMYDMAIDLLDEIDQGGLVLPGVDPSSAMKVSVGRTGANIFADLEELEEVDYYTYLYNETRVDRSETGPIDL